LVKKKLSVKKENSEQELKTMSCAYILRMRNGKIFMYYMGPEYDSKMFEIDSETLLLSEVPAPSKAQKSIRQEHTECLVIQVITDGTFVYVISEQKSDGENKPFLVEKYTSNDAFEFIDSRTLKVAYDDLSQARTFTFFTDGQTFIVLKTAGEEKVIQVYE
jgi:hypothetical protein